MSSKKRKSNIELLRIVAMIMIIFSHLAIYGVIDVPVSNSYMIWVKGSHFNQFLLAIYTAGGDVGVGVFFIITGYFLTDKYSDSLKSIKAIVGKVFFYTIFSCAFACIGKWCLGYSIKYSEIIAILLLPISSNKWWFITSYIVLLLMTPSLNKYFQSVNIKTKSIHICLLWFFWIIGGKILGAEYFSITKAIWFYLIGGSIKEWKLKENSNYLIILFWGNIFMYAICTYVIGYSIAGNLFGNYIGDFAKLCRSSLFAPTAAIVMFIIFKNLNITNEIVNKIAKNCLGIYLFHESPVLRKLIWNVIGRVDELYLGNAFALKSIFIVAIVFMIGCCVEQCRKALHVLIKKVINKGKSI